MKGNIYFINNNSYGRITAEDGDSYFFHKSALTNCTINQIEEGDAVEFTPGTNDKGNIAFDIRKRHQASAAQMVANPGIHPSVTFDHFNNDEEKIVRTLGDKSFRDSFYVTSGGGEFKLGESLYRYCLVKPTEYYNRMFQLYREIVIIFSDYVSFEPRSLDAAATVYKKVASKLRLDRGLQILICHDDNIEDKLLSLLKDNNVNQIVVPFTYRELLSNTAHNGLIASRFKKYLFDTDLFAVSAPITNDIFFFGRRDFVHDLVSKCKNNTHCGVFGLRRSGKTSLLYAVQNLLNQQDYPAVFIPCESDLRTLDWRTALCKVVRNIYHALNIDDSHIIEADYRTADTTIYFEDDMYRCLNNRSVPVTLMFDEIEAITFGVAQGEDSDNEWLDGKNFLHFWETIKGYYTKYPKQLSILVAGTNPMIAEEALICNRTETNPMFQQLSESNQGAYLQAFSIDDTRNMVNTLGGYMGMFFDEYSISRLTSDCGGHPYLMRILCSHISKYIRNKNIKRPATISKSIYDKAIVEFERSSEAVSFFWMVLNILMKGYPKEFATLKHLALEGDDIISQIQDKTALPHLIGYGLVEHNQNNYAIKYSTISRFLRGEYRFERQGLSIEEQKAEIHLRINNAEMQLRKLVKNTMLMTLGANKAKQRVLNAMQNNHAISPADCNKANNMTYSQLFDASTNKIYFSLLEGIILENLPIFSYVFESFDESIIKKNLTTINLSRRCPDHSYTEDAENWSWEKFQKFRDAMTWLESILKSFE